MRMEMTYSDLLKCIWQDVYNPKADTTEIIKKYFHPDYEQCINGVSLKRNEYIQHVLAQKQNMMITSIDYKHMLEKENELFALYYAEGKNTSNQSIEVEVIAYFLFENEQIFRIHGQVRLIKGNAADADMKNH
jgi:hypothetical protein